MSGFRNKDKRKRHPQNPATTDSIPWTPPKQGSLRARLEQERRDKRFVAKRGRPSQHVSRDVADMPGDDFDNPSYVPDSLSVIDGDEESYASHYDESQDYQEEEYPSMPDNQLDDEDLLMMVLENCDGEDLAVDYERWQEHDEPEQADGESVGGYDIYQAPIEEHLANQPVTQDGHEEREGRSVATAHAQASVTASPHDGRDGHRPYYGYADALRDIQEHGRVRGRATSIQPEPMQAESTQDDFDSPEPAHQDSRPTQLDYDPQLEFLQPELPQQELLQPESVGVATSAAPATSEYSEHETPDSKPLADEGHSNRQPSQDNPMSMQHSKPQISQGYQTQEEYEEEQYIKRAFQEFKRKRRRRKVKKLLGMLVFLGLVGGGGLYYWMTHQPQEEADAIDDAEMETTTAEAKMGILGLSVRAEGTTAPLSSSGIESQTSGTILDVMVAEGDHVQKGAVLLTITNEEYYAKVKDAESRVQEATDALGEAQRAFQDAYRTYETAYNESLQADDWESFDFSLEEEAKRTDAEVKKAQQLLDAAKGAHETVLAANAQESVKSVLSPISGSITKMKAVPGMKVEAGKDASDGEGKDADSLLQIVDVSQMIVTVQVNEIDIAKVQQGQQAKITFSALPGVESLGTVQKVANVASGYEDGERDADSASRGVVTYAVTLLIPEPDPQLKMGMTATAEIATASGEQHILVPEGALQEDEKGNSYVTVMDKKGETKNVTVKVIAIESPEAAIEGEVHEGDVVVSTGTGFHDDADSEPEPESEPEPDAAKDASAEEAE